MAAGSASVVGATLRTQSPIWPCHAAGGRWGARRGSIISAPLVGQWLAGLPVDGAARVVRAAVGTGGAGGNPLLEGGRRRAVAAAAHQVGEGLIRPRRDVVAADLPGQHHVFPAVQAVGLGGHVRAGYGADSARSAARTK